jgi:hypothetical protein
VVCPLCGVRKARRACPALGHQICAVCCGTKRLTHIRCPIDCAYLATAREHPPAIVVRQQQQDIELLIRWMRDFSRTQSQLFLAVATFFARYQPPAFQTLVDDDLVEAAAALAATYETASRGVIYEHRPASLPAERLMAALKPLLTEAGQGGGSAFERDAAFVLRRIEEGARSLRGTAENGRAFLDLLGRVMRKRDEGEADREAAAPEPSRLIVP